MLRKRLGFKVPIWVFEELDGQRLTQLLRDKLEVYLNHEDSDFPFEILSVPGFVVGRQSGINIDSVGLKDIGDTVSIA